MSNTTVTGLDQYSIERFQQDDPYSDTINILLSGSLWDNDNNTLSHYTNVEGEWEWVFDTDNWNLGTGQGLVSASLISGSIIGVTIATVDQQGNSNMNSFRSCEKLLLNIKLGSYNASKTLTITQKTIGTDYVYFEVKPEYLGDKVGDGNILVQFNCTPDVSGYKYNNYSCEVSASNIELNLEPVYSPVIDNSVFNSITNNVTSSVDSTIAKDVEVVASGSSTITKTVVYSKIPDSFFTSTTVQLGRSLGTKNSYTSYFNGDKQAFVAENLKIAVAATASDNVIETGVDRSFYTIQGFTGSIFPIDTPDSTIISMSLSNMEMAILGFVPKATYVTSSSKGEDYIDIRAMVSASVPGNRDIIYNSNTEAEYRVTDKKIYVKELGKVIMTDNYGHVSGSIL